MAALFEAYVTKHREICGGPSHRGGPPFPHHHRGGQRVLKQIGVDGVRYREYFITFFDSDILGLYDYLGEYENIDELNHLACLLSELDQGELEKFEAALNIGTHTSSVADIINLAQNLECFDFYPDIESEEDLGRYYTEDLLIPAELKDYFDYAGYGRDVSINEGGHFAPGGYIVQTSGDFKEYYHGRRTFPPSTRFSLSPALHPGADGRLQGNY